MDSTICEIYDKRPKICRDFPKTAEQIKHFDKCTFEFDENGKRSGYCCGCGQCCVNMPWPDGTDINTVDLEIAAVKDKKETIEYITINGVERETTSLRVKKDPICRFLVTE